MSGPDSKPRTDHARSTVAGEPGEQPHDEIERLRVAMQYALDALEDGDQGGAVDLLLAALEG